MHNETKRSQICIRYFESGPIQSCRNHQKPLGFNNRDREASKWENTELLMRAETSWGKQNWYESSVAFLLLTYSYENIEVVSTGPQTFSFKANLNLLPGYPPNNQIVFSLHDVYLTFSLVIQTQPCRKLWTSIEEIQFHSCRFRARELNVMGIWQSKSKASPSTGLLFSFTKRRASIFLT